MSNKTLWNSVNKHIFSINSPHQIALHEWFSILFDYPFVKTSTDYVVNKVVGFTKFR